MEEIKMKDWLCFHPYDVPDDFDVAYLNVAATIRTEMLDKGPYLDEEHAYSIALVLTAYLEDVVSSFGLWAAFRSLHEKRYKRLLPFVEINSDTYCTDKINKEDLQVLIWMTLMMDDDEASSDWRHPYEKELLRLVEIVYPIFKEVFERMPVNERLGRYYKNHEVYEDFESFKVMYRTFYKTGYLFLRLFDCYLSFDPNWSKLDENYEYIFSIRPLAEFGHTYLREMINGMDKESAYLEDIQIRQTEVYKYVGEENDDYLLSSFEDGGIYMVDAKSTEYRPEKMQDGLIEARLVFYKGKWHLTEVCTSETQKNLAYYLEVREHEAKENEENRVMNEQFLKANNNSPIAFFKNRKALKAAIKKIYSKIPSNIKFDLKYSEKEPFVVFADSNSGVRVHGEFTSSIKHPDNPYYNQEEAENAELVLLRYKSHSNDALQRYLIREKLIPDLRFCTSENDELETRLVQENMDFMARFFWDHDYTGVAFERVEV
ncbi:MAG: DUF3843 family protein [Tannerellaceae bacterium]